MVTSTLVNTIQDPKPDLLNNMVRIEPLIR